MTEPAVIYIDCHCEADPAIPYDVAALCAGAQPGIFRDFVPPNALTFSAVDQLILFVSRGGYWPMAFESPRRRITGVIPKLPPGPVGWWHSFHGVDTTDPTRGKGMKIGVIDEALPLQTSGPLAHIENLGGLAWGAQGDRPYRTLGSGHGEMVCSVLGANPAGKFDFEGIAPGATLCFCAAGADDTDKLGAPRLAESIYHLAEVEGCDIITFSAGDVDVALPELEAALEDATDLGVLCFGAAGNKGEAPLYPARYDDCLSVGALGRVGFAPPQTEDWRDARASREVRGSEFLWQASARGPGVKFLGAGASILYTGPCGRSFAISGTSFAGPIVAGVAALILENDHIYQSLESDRKRVEYALGKFRSMSSNPFTGLASIGILRA
jgi:subtilisin family serine protease